MDSISLLGTSAGLGLASGLNLYAMVFVTGLCLQLGWLQPTAGLEGLAVMAHPAVLATAGLLYVVEFVADKIPVVEHVWDVIHTFLRPLGAVLIVMGGLSGAHLPAGTETIAMLLAGGIALTSHSAKAGARVSASLAGGHTLGAGVGLSLLEDLLVVGIVPLAMQHPRVMLGIALVFLIAFALLAPPLYRLFHSRALFLKHAIRHKVLRRNATGLLRHELPSRVVESLERAGGPGEKSVLLPARVYGFPGIPRWASGYAQLTPEGIVFVNAGWFRLRSAEVSWRNGAPQLIEGVTGLELVVDCLDGRRRVVFYPLTSGMHDALRNVLPRSASAPVGGALLSAPGS